MDYGIPIYSKVVDGNESDKTINQNLIPEMVKRMRDLGADDFVYVNDSALSFQKVFESIVVSSSDASGL